MTDSKWLTINKMKIMLMWDILLRQDTNWIFIRSSKCTNKVNSKYIEDTQLQKEEYLRDVLFVDGYKENLGNHEDKNALMERVNDWQRKISKFK